MPVVESGLRIKVRFSRTVIHTDVFMPAYLIRRRAIPARIQGLQIRGDEPGLIIVEPAAAFQRRNGWWTTRMILSFGSTPAKKARGSDAQVATIQPGVGDRSRAACVLAGTHERPAKRPSCSIELVVKARKAGRACAALAGHFTERSQVDGVVAP